MMMRFLVITALTISLVPVAHAGPVPGHCWPKCSSPSTGGTGMNHGIGNALKGLAYKIKRNMKTSLPPTATQKKLRQ